MLCPVTGDQVSKKGGMTGGFYDYRRSRLKFMNIIRQNMMAINKKENDLKEVRELLNDILLAVLNLIHLCLVHFQSTSQYNFCLS